MLSVKIAEFIQNYCTLGRCLQSDALYRADGALLCREFNTFLPTTSQAFYEALLDPNNGYGLTKEKKSHGYVVNGIIMNKDIPTFRRPSKRYASVDERRMYERERKREYRARIKELDATITQAPAESHDGKLYSKKNLPRPSITMNPFVWDGSDIGRLNEDELMLIGTSQKTGKKYWRITIGNFHTIAMIIRSPSSLPCVIDELKSIFGLPKIGTHRCRLPDSNKCILLRVAVDQRNNIVEEVPLDSITLESYDVPLLESIRRTLAFREALGIKKTTENNLWLRRDHTGNLCVVGSGESNVISLGSDKVIKDILRERWFGVKEKPCPIDQTIFMTWINAYDQEGLSSKLNSIREQVNVTIHRVDHKHIPYVSQIMTRIWAKAYLLLAGVDH